MEILKKTLLCLILCTLFISCLEQDDNQGPRIQFFKPQENSVISLPDTLEVQVKVTDDNLLRMVAIDLVDANNAPVTQGKYFYPAASEYTVNTYLELVDKTIESGQHHVRVIADDGYSSVSAYLPVSIQAIPQEIIGYFAATKPISFKSGIFRLGLNFVVDSQMVINETWYLSGINSNYRQFYFINDEPSVLKAFDPFTFEKLWDMNASQPRALFTDIYNDDEFLFSTDNGDCGVLRSDGEIIVRTAPYDDKTITCLAADETYIYAGHQSLNGDINQLTVYYRVTGEIRVQETLSGEIMDLLPVGNAVMVFLHSNTDIRIITYNPEDFTLIASVMLASEFFISAEKISNQEILILTERSVISYNAMNQHFTDFASEPFEFCRYDYLNDVVFLGKDVRVFCYDRSNGNLLTIIPFNDEVVDFQILYNK